MTFHKLKIFLDYKTLIFIVEKNKFPTPEEVILKQQLLFLNFNEILSPHPGNQVA